MRGVFLTFSLFCCCVRDPNTFPSRCPEGGLEPGPPQPHGTAREHRNHSATGQLVAEVNLDELELKIGATVALHAAEMRNIYKNREEGTGRYGSPVTVKRRNKATEQHGAGIIGLFELCQKV